MNTLELTLADDLHVHCRDGGMMKEVVPLVAKGGAGRIIVMPNLVPPVTSVQMALDYKKRLEAEEPSIDYLMTLYLHPDITPQDIRKAAASGIKGVKSYPRGVTTNSEVGIENYEDYYPVFKAMEEEGMILNLHGEVPSDPTNNICVLNAEARFLPQLEKIHRAFPKLRIVLEHCTTAAAIQKVKSLGETVGATITVHHIDLTIDDWAGNMHNFCKPVPKYPSDREAIRQVIREGHPRFFLGSDSAPHPRHKKEAHFCSAGVFTSAYLLPYLAHIFEKLGCLHNLKNFACVNGAAFYGLPPQTKAIKLVKKPCKVVDHFVLSKDGEKGELVPFMSSQTLDWSIEESS